MGKRLWKHAFASHLSPLHPHVQLVQLVQIRTFNLHPLPSLVRSKLSFKCSQVLCTSFSQHLSQLEFYINLCACLITWLPCWSTGSMKMGTYLFFAHT